MATIVRINRAPVLTLLATIVAERSGFDWEEALTLGRAVAGLNAYSKGVHLGMYEPTPQAEMERRKAARGGETLHIALLGRAVPAVQTAEGIRALEKEKPSNPASVERYLRSKFGEDFDAAKEAMERLANSFTPRDLARVGFQLYEQLRPTIPAGTKGWGAAGELNLDVIAKLVDAE